MRCHATSNISTGIAFVNSSREFFEVYRNACVFSANRNQYTVNAVRLRNALINLNLRPTSAREDDEPVECLGYLCGGIIFDEHIVYVFESSSSVHNSAIKFNQFKTPSNLGDFLQIRFTYEFGA